MAVRLFPATAARILALSLLAALVSPSASAQGVTDSLAVRIDSAFVILPAADSADVRTPRGAVTRALALPGWGQVYNGQTTKAPFVVAGLGVAIGYAVYQQRSYVRYRRAALYAGCLEVSEREPCVNLEVPMATWGELGEPSGSAVRSARDRVRGRRDIAFLGVGVVYALQALDAYIAAELADFDVSDDLSLHVVPMGDGVMLAARVRL